VVDELQRDFTANLSGAVAQRTLLRDPMGLSHQPGQSWSAKLAGVYQQQFTGYAVGQNVAATTMSLDNRMFGARGPWQHQVTLTQNAINPFVQYAGAWGSVQGASTLEYDATYRAESGAWAQAGVASTSTVATPGMIERVGSIQSVHAVVGYSHAGMNIYAGIQPWMVSGALHLRLPGQVDEQGVMRYEHSRVSLAGARPVAYAGMNWSQPITRESTVIMGLAANETGDYRASVNLTRRF
jgi:hypothetical protein